MGETRCHKALVKGLPATAVGHKDFSRSTKHKVVGAKKRVLSAAGRAAIVKATKKRSAKVRKQAKKTTG
jgi:hypothetical protein